MWQGKDLTLHDEVAEEDEIQVEHTRSLCDCLRSIAPQRALNLHETIEKRSWLKLCLEQSGGVKKARLIKVADRRSVVEARSNQYGSKAGKLLDREIKIHGTIAEFRIEIGTERDGRDLFWLQSITLGSDRDEPW